MFFALFRLSVSEARPLSVSVALGLSIRFTGTSSTMKNKHMGGICQDVKGLKIWDFYPLYFGSS